MRRLDLLPDCGSCAALCCVATAFDAGEDFAIDKPAGARCPHLTNDHRCAIHAERAARGFRGCTAYDCHGAGPHVTRTLGPDALAAFLERRELHERLWLLTEARRLLPPAARALPRRVGHTLGGGGAC